MELLLATNLSDAVAGALTGVQINDSFSSSLIDKIVPIATAIAGICFLCSLGFNYGKSAFKALFSADSSEFPNYMEIGRGLLMIICIAVYPAIADILSTSIKACVNPTFESAESRKAGAESKYAIHSKSYAPGTDEWFGQQKIINGGQPVDSTANNQKGISTDPNQQTSTATTGIFDILQNFVMYVFHQTFQFLSNVISVMLVSYCLFMLKVLLIIGPLAFAFCILPCFERQVSIWFGTLMNTGMTMLTLNIIGAMFNAMGKVITTAPLSSTVEGTVSIDISVLIYDIILVATNLSAFWLTSKFVGKPDGSKVLTKGIAMTSQVAQLAMTGAAAAAVGAGTLSRAVNIGADSIKNN